MYTYTPMHIHAYILVPIPPPAQHKITWQGSALLNHYTCLIMLFLPPAARKLAPCRLPLRRRPRLKRLAVPIGAPRRSLLATFVQPPCRKPKL